MSKCAPNTSPKSATGHTHTHHKHKTRNPHTTPVPDPIPGTDPLIFSLFPSFPTHSGVPAWTQGHMGPNQKGPETDDRTMTREDNTPSMTIITTSEEVIRERCSPVTLELVQETPNDDGQTHAQWVLSTPPTPHRTRTREEHLEPPSTPIAQTTEGPIREGRSPVTMEPVQEPPTDTERQ